MTLMTPPLFSTRRRCGALLQDVSKSEDVREEIGYRDAAASQKKREKHFGSFHVAVLHKLDLQG